MTGTPEGMGPVNEGDNLVAQLKYDGKVLAEIKDTIKRSEI